MLNKEHIEKNNKNILGNMDLVSSEEEKVVLALKKNLKKVNEKANPVYPPKTFYTKYGKRVLDILISFPLFIILLPVNFIFAICTFIDVGIPIFYRQTRVGLNGKYFTLIKFRNMNEDVDKNGKMLPPSQRVTKFGKIMRKYSFDELLNIWAILKGDMSIIGPRPQPIFIYERMSERHKMRAKVRPGLECPRVIHVEGEDVCKFQRTYENDIWYVENVNLRLDIKMFFLLIKMVFNIKKRENQAIGKGISYFVGYNEDGIAISMNVYKKLANEKEMGQE